MVSIINLLHCNFVILYYHHILINKIAPQQFAARISKEGSIKKKDNLMSNMGANVVITWILNIHSHFSLLRNWNFRKCGMGFYSTDATACTEMDFKIHVHSVNVRDIRTVSWSHGPHACRLNICSRDIHNNIHHLINIVCLIVVSMQIYLLSMYSVYNAIQVLKIKVVSVVKLM